MSARRTILSAAAATVAAALVATVTTRRTRAAEDEEAQPRDVAGFDRIRVNGAFNVDVTAGAAHPHVVVKGEPDLVARTTTAVEGGTLVIGMKSGPMFGHAPSVSIQLPALHGFENTGVGSSKLNGLTGGPLSLALSGTGSIMASGRASVLDIALNGTGKVDTTALDAHDVTVNNNGVGSVKLRASGNLTMNVNGVGSISYTGTPTNVESHVNGIGRINRM